MRNILVFILTLAALSGCAPDSNFPEDSQEYDEEIITEDWEPQAASYDLIVSTIKLACYGSCGVKIIDACNTRADRALCVTSETNVRIPFVKFNNETGLCEIRTLILARTLGNHLRWPNVKNLFENKRTMLHLAQDSALCDLPQPKQLLVSE